MFGGGSAPILVLSQGTKRDSGRKIQEENIQAAKAVGDLVRTCLGPKAMLKMLMDPMGGIVMTNDGNAILREITVQVSRLATCPGCWGLLRKKSCPLTASSR